MQVTSIAMSVWPVQEAPLRPSEWPVQQEQTVQVTMTCTGGTTTTIGVVSTAGTNCASNQHYYECVACTGGTTTTIGVASTAGKICAGKKH